jgi:hypothetical protein
VQVLAEQPARHLAVVAEHPQPGAGDLDDRRVGAVVALGRVLPAGARRRISGCPSGRGEKMTFSIELMKIERRVRDTSYCRSGI